jgi:hypothetical protein
MQAQCFGHQRVSKKLRPSGRRQMLSPTPVTRSDIMGANEYMQGAEGDTKYEERQQLFMRVYNSVEIHERPSQTKRSPRTIILQERKGIEAVAVHLLAKQLIDHNKDV